jgi:hypothetical protein
MTRMHATALLVFVLILPVREIARSQGSAGDGTAAPAVRSAGTLASHTFVPSTFMRDPFIRTSLMTGLGFGLTPALETPPVEINGVPVESVKGSLLFALMGFEYQQEIRDWLALKGNVRVAGRLADETRPLLSQGVTLFAGFDLGWLFRVMESERTFLSGSLEIRNASLTDVYLKRFIEGIIDSGGVSHSNQLVETTPALQGGGGLHAAHAFSELVGLTVNADLFYGESTDRSAGQLWSYLVRAAVDFNLLCDGGPPVGFVLGATVGSTLDIPGAEEKATQTFFGRIGYTGSREFALGLDLAYELVPIRNIENRQGFVSAVIEIRLYF